MKKGQEFTGRRADIIGAQTQWDAKNKKGTISLADAQNHRGANS